MARHNHNFSFPQRQSFSSFNPLWIFLLAFAAILCFAHAAHAAQVTLAWDPNTQTDVTGYKIYWGTSSGNYTNSVDVGNVTTYTVTGLNSGTTYYFVATCYTGSGTESGYSNQVFTTTPSGQHPPGGFQRESGHSRRTPPAGGTLAATDADGNSLTYSLVASGTKGSRHHHRRQRLLSPTPPISTPTAPIPSPSRPTTARPIPTSPRVTVTITAVNDAPVASSGTLSVSRQTTWKRGPGSHRCRWQRPHLQPGD